MVYLLRKKSHEKESMVVAAHQRLGLRVSFLSSLHSLYRSIRNLTPSVLLLVELLFSLRHSLKRVYLTGHSFHWTLFLHTVKAQGLHPCLHLGFAFYCVHLAVATSTDVCGSRGDLRAVSSVGLCVQQVIWPYTGNPTSTDRFCSFYLENISKKEHLSGQTVFTDTC